MSYTRRTGRPERTNLQYTGRAGRAKIETCCFHHEWTVTAVVSRRPRDSHLEFNPRPMYRRGARHHPKIQVLAKT